MRSEKGSREPWAGKEVSQLNALTLFSVLVALLPTQGNRQRQIRVSGRDNVTGGYYRELLFHDRQR